MAPRKRTQDLPQNAPPAPTATQEVDEQLERYRAMRDFSATAEPSGGAGAEWAPPGGLPFVIQKHAATRLHYDFRLGWRGVLKSWACAKGPSYNTRDRRLAVQVEDHPMEYGGFEGTIPKGQYGGGTVMVWDQGTWEPLPGYDFDEGLRKGTVKFTLHGHKLEGRWTLVRMKPRPGDRAAAEKPNWLLIKEHDGNERLEDAPQITDEAPDSVVTGRSLEGIAAAEDHVWNSRPAEHTPAPANHSRLRERVKEARLGRAPGTKTAASPQAAHENAERAGAASPRPAGDLVAGKEEKPREGSTAESWLAGAPAEPMPPFLAPQLAAAADTIPPGSGWLHELKLDGYRIQVHVRPGATGKRQATLFTRSGLDWTHRMKAVARAAEKLPVEQAVLDGEVVVLDEAGKTSFSKLQAAFEQGEAATLRYFAFDLLHLDGHNLRGLPLRIRKQQLQPLIEGAIDGSADPLLAFSQHLQIAASEVFEHACALGAEGILSKSAESRYTGGRSDTWLKLKCTHRQEFVIAGFTLPKDRGEGIGSLLLGYYEGSKLIHCGRCGTGFTQASAREVRKQLEPLRTDKPAYSGALSREAKKDAIWLRPELVCEVQFATWTADGSVRHASFQGMRLDKPASEVVKEEPNLPGEQTGSSQADAPNPQAQSQNGYAESHEESQSADVEPHAAAQDDATSRTRAATRADKKDTGAGQAGSRGSAVAEKQASRHAATRANGRSEAPGQTGLAGGAGADRVVSRQTTEPPESQALAMPQSEQAKAAADRTAKPAGPRLTHPDKIIDTATGVTKQQLAQYFEAVAPAMLPHIANRPLSIVRCPSGSTEQCFFQKHAKVGLPASVGSIDVPDKDNPAHSEPYIAVDSAAALVGLAQLGVLELHPWGSEAGSLEQPDRIILDLDPDEALPWSTVVESAQLIRTFLRDLQLESFIKTTGGKGLHIVVAIEPAAEWPDIRLFSRGIAAAIESSNPRLYLIKMTKAARKGRIFIDWMRNERGATAVAPWSPRARAGMRVAVPLAWDELAAGPPAFAVANFQDWRDRVEPAQDPWAAMRPQRLLPEVLKTVLQQSAAPEKHHRRA